MLDERARTSEETRRRVRPITPIWVASLALLTALLAWLSREVSFSEQNYSLVWPPAGIALACVLAFGLRGLLPPLLGLGAWALATFGFGLGPGEAVDEPLQALGLMLGTVLADGVAATVGAAVFLHLNQGRRLLWGQNALLRFFVVVLFVITPLAGLLGSLGFWLSDLYADVAFAWIFAGYAISQAAGALLFAPWLLTALRPPAELDTDEEPSVLEVVRRSLSPDSLALLALLLSIGLMILGYQNGVPEIATNVKYVLLPVMAMCAISRPPMVTLTTLVVGIGLLLLTSAWVTQAGLAGPDTNQAFVLFEITVVMLLTTLLTLLLMVANQTQRFAMASMRRQAFTDVQTGLLNERGLLDRLASVLDGSASQPAVLCLEIRALNTDTLLHLGGYSGSVQLVQEIAHRLQQRMPGAIVARISQTRYAVALPGIDRHQGTSLAFDLHDLLAGIHFHGETTTAPIALRCCVGGVWLASGQALSAEQLLVSAREACALAMRQSSVAVHVDDASPEQLAQRAAGLRRAEELRRQILGDGLLLWAQGIASNQLDRLGEGLHLELLCRLRDADGRILTPETFMPVVAAENIERLLDQRVIEKAFAWFADHREALARIDRVSINVSGASISDPGFAHYVRQALGRHKLAAHQFCFEITETALIQNFDVARQWVDAVHELGFRVVLDDFGTGVATFDYLKRLPVDGVKIDGAFIRQIHQSALDEQIVAAVVAIARSLGKYTVAEFVSDSLILEKVVALGVDYSQGWALGRAEPIETLLADPVTAQHRFSLTGTLLKPSDSSHSN